jgi:hypothetical protein
VVFDIPLDMLYEVLTTRKDFYNKSDNTIVGAYKLISDSGESIQILNIQYQMQYGIIFMDNKQSYNIVAQKAVIPKSKIQYVRDEALDGFVVVKMPYGLYKSYGKKLRISKPDLTDCRINPYQKGYPKTHAYYLDFNDPDIIDYLEKTEEVNQA